MRPLKLLLLALALAAAGTVAHAAAPQATMQAAAGAAATRTAPVPLLWKVSDADNSLYLLGSFHMLMANDYPLSADVDAAFADAESMLFEIDPAAMTAPDTIAKFQKASTYDDGRTLSQVLPAATRARLEKLLAASGSSIAAFEAAEPWAVNLGLVLGISQAMGFRSEDGLDRHFMALAKASGKPVAGLETIDTQMAALDGTPHAEQIAGLDEFLADPTRAVTELRSLHASWRAGDLKALDQTFRVDMARKSPVSYKLINVERNDAWMSTLEQRLKAPGSDDTLAVVGTLHLLGNDGVVEKLRAKGYKVERVCSVCARKKH
jgi:uncharacterized protein YbaP (TraB family)